MAKSEGALRSADDFGPVTLSDAQIRRASMYVAYRFRKDHPAAVEMLEMLGLYIPKKENTE